MHTRCNPWWKRWSEDRKAGCAALEVLPEAERRQVLEEWNRTGRQYPGKCIHELFEEQAERTPEAVAVVYGERAAELWGAERAGEPLAHHLGSMGVRPEAGGDLCVERSVEMVVGLLGVLKAGGAYVPLDPSIRRSG